MELNWFTHLNPQIRKPRPRKVAKYPPQCHILCYLVADTWLKIWTLLLQSNVFLILFATLLEVLCTGKMAGAFEMELFKVETVSGREEEA